MERSRNLGIQHRISLTTRRSRRGNARTKGFESPFHCFALLPRAVSPDGIRAPSLVPSQLPSSSSLPRPLVRKAGPRSVSKATTCLSACKRAHSFPGRGRDKATHEVRRRTRGIGGAGSAGPASGCSQACALCARLTDSASQSVARPPHDRRRGPPTVPHAARNLEPRSLTYLF